MPNTAGLIIRACVGDQHANVMDVYINNVPYEYRPRADAASTARKVNRMAIISHGKALQWVKKNCQYIGKALR